MPVIIDICICILIASCNWHEMPGYLPPRNHILNLLMFLILLYLSDIWHFLQSRLTLNRLAILFICCFFRTFWFSSTFANRRVFNVTVIRTSGITCIARSRDSILCNSSRDTLLTRRFIREKKRNIPGNF